nr:hypothetical protein [Tanacetum cinerariifolium]
MPCRNLAWWTASHSPFMLNQQKSPHLADKLHLQHHSITGFHEQLLQVEVLENDKVAQQLEIVKLKARVKKLEKLNKVKSSKLRRLKKVGTSQRVESSDDVENVFNQGRISVDMDQDERIELVVDHEKDVEVLSMQEDDTEVQEAVEVVTTAKLMTEVVTTAATQVVAASTPIPAAKPKTLTITAAPAVSTRMRKGVVIIDPEEELHTDTLAETPIVKDKGKGILIEAPKPMKKKDRVEMDADYAKKLQEELDKEHEEAYKNIDWNVALDHVQSKEPQYIKRYHGIKKKPQTKFEARKNMISYLKNTEGYKMEFLKGKMYDEILPIFQARFDANMKFLLKLREEMEKEDEEIIKSINETPAQKATKRRKLSEEAQEAEDLRRRLEIVQDEDDDVFVEAILLAQKVLVVDYQIVVIDNRPKFSTSKPTNFLDEYLLLTHKTMFGELDEQDPIWRNQKSVHGLALVKRWKLLTSCGVHVITLSTFQLFLLVEIRYPLSKFTLEQLVNMARLQVEEEKYHDEIKIDELKGNFNRISIEINKKEKLQQLEQVANLSTYPSKRFNSFCYYDDDDEDYTVVITPNFLITDSLIMESGSLDTIPETKSDEFIKSSVENLVPIPKIISIEFNPIHNEDLDSTPKNDRFDTKSYLLESLLNRDTLMASSLKFDSLLEEFSGELAHTNLISPGINEANCDPEEDIHLVERLLYNSDSEGDNIFLERLLHDDPIPLSDILDFSNVVRDFLPFFTYLVTFSTLLSSGSEDTIFDPGISDYHLSSFMPGVSHRSGTFMKFIVYPNHLNEIPMKMLSSTCSSMDQ